MPAVAIASGVVLGAFTAVVWRSVINRSDTRPLFLALGRSMRAMVSEDGHFFREYGALLLRVGSFALWNLLALVAALTPIIVVEWIFWPHFSGNQVSLIMAYSLTSLGGILWLGRRAKRSAAGKSDHGLSVSDSQYFFLQVVESAPWLMRRGAALETRILRRRLSTIQIDRPVFVAGLARSGTTMLLELLSQVPGVATHRYRDFPFLLTPYLWNQFVSLFGVTVDAIQRPHQDGIFITPESPDAFEEPIWQHYFPEVHRLAYSHVLDANSRNEQFDKTFVEHIRKMLLIRDGVRYVSKGNYNLTRIEYIGSLFPDARFLVPVRHPTTHVASLAHQHDLFCGYSREDRRVPHYLAAAGHFEFGPQRVPLSVRGSAEETRALWEAGDEHRGYALQWKAAYGYVLDLLDRSPWVGDHVMVVRYEDICDRPRVEMAKILQHVGLEKEGAVLLGNLSHIKTSIRHRSSHEETNEAVWELTSGVAAAFGYGPTGRMKNWNHANTSGR